MNYEPFNESLLEDFIRTNEDLIQKAKLKKNLLRIVWLLVTLAGAYVFLIDWFSAIFTTAFAFMITGVIVQTISNRDYDKILKNSIHHFPEIAQYNNSDIEENFITFDLFPTECKSFEFDKQFIVSENSKFVDFHTLVVWNHYRRNNRRHSYEVWEGLVIGMQHSTQLNYKLYVTTSEAFFIPPVAVQDPALVPFCHNYKVQVSDSQIFEHWSMPGLSNLVEEIASFGKPFTLMITSQNIVVAFDDNEKYKNFFSPVLWTGNVKENLTDDFILLSKLVKVSKLIANFQIIER